MQLYVLDRAKNTLATTSDYYNDKHTKTLEAGSSSYEFTIDKTDEAAQQMVSGNYIITQDDQGRNWAFTILDYDETHLTKTVYCEDVGIELINKAMDIWPNTGTHPFEYYFDLVTKDTPWKLGINQLSGSTRTLTYTGQDTGLGRLLSILTGFDHAECIFNVNFTMNAPVEFTIDVYKQIGTVQSNIQIVYNNELDDIKKTESRVEFVTALKGVGGTIEPEVSDDGTTTATTTDTQETVDFSDLEYDDGDYYTVKGDPFLRARTANKKFNPGDNGWIENFYSYDTQDPKELLNRTITQLKTYSEPQYSYEAEVKVIDATLDIGDTVTIIDHDYQPALYLSARVATLEKSYTDPTKNTVTFTNYQLLNSSLTGRIKDLQNIINGMPTSAQITAINANLVKLVAANNQLKQQLEVVITSADGTTNNYYGETQPSDAKEGDTWFKKVDGKVVEIDTYVNGEWVPITLTTDQVKNMVDDATKGIPQMKVNIETAVNKAQDAADKFSQANDTLTDVNKLATGAKTDAANAADQAISAFNSAKSAAADAASALSSAGDAQSDAASALTTAQNAISTANGVSKTVTSISTDVDTLKGTVKTLATSKAVDALSKTVTDAQTLSTQNATELTNKADKTTVNTLNQTVKTQGAQLALTATGADLATTQKQVDQINQTVSDQGAKLALTATTADLSVQQKLVDQLQQTVTDQGAKLALTATGAELSATQQTVSGISDKLDNLKFSSRNLLRNTAFRDDLSHWTIAGGTTHKMSLDTVNKYSGNNSIHIVSTGAGGGATGFVGSDVIGSPQAGDALTLAFYAKSISGNASLHTELTRSNGATNIQITSEWALYIAHLIFEAGTGFYFWLNGAGECLINSPMLIAGGNAGIWSPAPEDDANLISGLQATVTKTSASLDITNQQLALKADKTITDGINQTINDISAKQVVQAGLIDTMATKTYVDTSTAGMATESYISGQIQVASDKITHTVEQVQTQLENQSVGVRNLLPNSNFNATFSASSTVTDLSVPLKAGDVVTITMNGHIDQQAQNDGKFMRGYVYAKGWPTDGNMMIADLASLDDTTVQKTFTVAKDYAYQFYATMYPQGGNRTGQVTLNWATIVIGNQAPITWFPASEDQATVTALTNVSQTIDAVKLMATNTQSDLTALTVKANGWQATVSDQIKGVTNTQTSLANQLTSIISTGDNLMVGGDFEHESLGKSQYWNSNGMIVTNGDKTSGLNTSNQCMRITGSTTNNIDNTSNILIPVTQQEYEVGMKVRWGAPSQTGAVLLYLFQYDANRQLISPTVVISDTSVGSWKAISGTYTPAADVRYVALDVTYSQGTTTGIIDFDDIYIKPNNATASQFTQLQNLVSANVTVAGKIAAQLSLSSDGGGTALLAGNHVHITGATTIDDASIQSAAIANLSADKITTGTLNASNVKVINIDGANIVANSITGNQLSAQAIQVGLSNWGQDMALQPSGIIMHDGENIVFELNKTGIWVSDGTNGTETGWIHSNHIVAHPEIYGLTFDLAHAAHFMSWGYQDTADGNYGIKMAWYDTPSAKIMNTGQGFQFNNSVHMHAKTVFHGGIYPAGTRDEDESHLNFKTYTINGLRGIGLVNDNGYGLVITDAGGIWLNAGNTAYDLLNMVKNVKW